MNILVACEESQRVCAAFREKGHRAFSCDIIDCSGYHPEWHIKQDVIPLLNGDCDFQTADGLHHIQEGRWDMIIAFPPCTKTSNAGAKHLWKGHKLNLQRYYEGLCGKALFETIRHADCDKIIVENPTPSKIFEYPEPTQKIQPYQFGDPYTKLTLLWEKGVEPLKPTNIVEPKATWCPSSCSRFAGTDKNKGTVHKAAERSKTFPGIAKAMVEQWG